MPKETVTELAPDGFGIAIDLFLPEGAVCGAVVIASAMAVPRAFYGNFAAHLADQGFVVATFDYRGIGGSAPTSLRGFSATLEDWARLDLATCLALVARRFPDAPKRFIGHSVGGQLFGLLEDTRGVDRALFVASQSGYWRNWTGVARYAMGTLWHLVVPTVVPIVGYLPMKALRQGLNVPAGVAQQWASWGRNPRYIGVSSTPGSAFETFAGPIRMVAFTDDPYAPPATVHALGELYRCAEITRTTIAPSDLGRSQVGHFSAFRRELRERLWGELTAWVAFGTAAQANVPPIG